MGQVPRTPCPQCSSPIIGENVGFGGNTTCPKCQLVYHYCPTVPPTLTKGGARPPSCGRCIHAKTNTTITCPSCGERGNGEKFRFDYDNTNIVTCWKCETQVDRGQ
jgi:hypothetical protein